MDKTGRSCHRARAATKVTIFSISYLLLAAAGANQVGAQDSPPAQAAPADESASPPVAPAQEPPSSPSAPSSSQLAPSSAPAETPTQQTVRHNRIAAGQR